MSPASTRRFGTARQIAEEIRDRILGTTGLHASFGVATCKTIAKIASDLRKPRGFVVVEPGDEAAFLAPLPLRRLPGLGPAAERALSGLGISTLGQLAALPARHRAAAGRTRLRNITLGARAGNRHRTGHRPRRAAKRLSRGDLRPRRRAA